MSIERSEVSPTLRGEAHAHEPVICYGFAHEQGSKAGSLAWHPEVSPTLRGGGAGNDRADSKGGAG